MLQDWCDEWDYMLDYTLSGNVLVIHPFAFGIMKCHLIHLLQVWYVLHMHKVVPIMQAVLGNIQFASIENHYNQFQAPWNRLDPLIMLVLPLNSWRNGPWYIYSYHILFNTVPIPHTTRSLAYAFWHLLHIMVLFVHVLYIHSNQLLLQLPKNTPHAFHHVFL